jgi:RES domain-containing protein
MILWRLSAERYVRVFDGGYGRLYQGRWNSAGHPVTYSSTSPSLCVLEKLLHIQDPNLLPIAATTPFGDIFSKSST